MIRAMMIRVILIATVFAVTLPTPFSHAQSGTDETANIRAVLSKQADDWNRGDMDAFASGYKNSPDILFVGPVVRRGYQQMLDSYRSGYSNKEAMGVLSFSKIEVHLVDPHVATVIGHFHLERTAAGGGNADGFYSLVLEKTPEGWKIILDHTEASAPKKKAP